MHIESLDNLLALIPELKGSGLGEWADTGQHAGTPEDPLVMPHVNYEGDVDRKLSEAIYSIMDANPEIDLANYPAILEQNRLEKTDESLRNADISKLDSVCLLAMILSIVRADRFNEGALLRYLNNGQILSWMKRLQELASLS